MSNSSGTSRFHFEPAFAAGRPVAALLALYRGHWAALLGSIVCHVIKHSPVWIFPAVTAKFVDIAARPDAHSTAELVHWTIVLAVVLIQNPFLHYAFTALLSRASRRMEEDLRFSLCRTMLELSAAGFGRRSVGHLQSKILRDVESVEQLTRLVFDHGVACLTNIVFALAIAGSMQKWFLGFFAVAVPITAAVMYFLRRPITSRNEILRADFERMSAQVLETAHLLPVTRAHGLETTALERVKVVLARLRHSGYRVDQINAIFGSLSWTAFNAFSMACLVLAAALAISRLLPITPGEMVAVSQYFGLITNSVLGVLALFPVVAKGLEATRSIGEVFAAAEREENEGKPPMPAVAGGFVFEQARVVYPGSVKPALEQFSLTVSPGETIALVGPSGAGKSTVLGLAIGFLHPCAGRVLVDGCDLREYDLRTYRRHLAVVPQETVLFNGTVRENVAYGIADVPSAAIERALRDANAWEFVAALPEGMDTPVGERGSRLSGGQRQRLAIARAIVRDPRVLILDEAMSALDTENEAAIQEALERLMRGRTTFIVAHRISSVRAADKIVVVESGRIVETGRHEVLVAAGGLYARMYSRFSFT